MIWGKTPYELKGHYLINQYSPKLRDRYHDNLQPVKLHLSQCDIITPDQQNKIAQWSNYDFEGLLDYLSNIFNNLSDYEVFLCPLLNPKSPDQQRDDADINQTDVQSFQSLTQWW